MIAHSPHDYLPLQVGFRETPEAIGCRQIDESLVARAAGPASSPTTSTPPGSYLSKVTEIAAGRFPQLPVVPTECILANLRGARFWHRLAQPFMAGGTGWAYCCP
jgi:hypothetical protein